MSVSPCQGAVRGAVHGHLGLRGVRGQHHARHGGAPGPPQEAAQLQGGLHACVSVTGSE